MRMPVEVPRSAIGPVPDAQGVVTEHDRLAVGLKLQSDRQAMRIPLLICVPACRDCRAPQRSSCIESVADKHGPLSGFHTKITQEIKNIIGFHGRIQPFDNCLVHLFDGRERAAAVADDDRVSEVEVGGGPSVWHSLRRKVEMLTLATNTCSLGERTLRSPREPAWSEPQQKRISCAR